MAEVPSGLVVLHRSPDHTLYAPTVAGTLVAWLSVLGEPKECRRGVRRVEALTPGGGTRIVAQTGFDHFRRCVFRPVASTRGVYWAEVGRNSNFTWTYGWSPGQRFATRAVEAARWFIGPSYDIRGTEVVVGRDGYNNASTTRVELPGFYGIVPGTPSVALNLWPRYLNGAGRDIIFVLPAATEISGAPRALPLPAGFDGLDAGDGQIAVRIHDPDGYRLLEIDPASGEQRTLLSGVEQLSLPAVADAQAAILRRDGNREQLLLLPLTVAGTPRVLATRDGPPRWGAGEIAEGRPVAYDGTRVVFTAGRSVLAVTPATP
jgi:hypothetical protein